LTKDNEILQIIGANIRMLRHYQGYSQEGFASHIEMDRSYLGCIERGERNISSLNLVRISKGLGVKVGELFTGI
jgi:transcriptional regulator with XRE-family HTH domain